MSGKTTSKKKWVELSTNIKNKQENKHYERFSSIPYKSSSSIFKAIQETGAIVFGASGEMGAKITSTFPRASVKVLMQDIDKEKLNETKNNVMETHEKAQKRRKLSKNQLQIIKEKKLVSEIITFPEKGKIPFAELDKGKEFVTGFLKKILPGDNVRSSYTNAMMVLEAGPEVLAFKQNVFKFFELALASNKAILATNTSSLKVSEIAQKTLNPERAVGFHYFLPAHTNPLIEIIVGEKTSLEVVQAMQNLAISMGKKPIVCWGDSQGAIANRILVGVLNEAAKIYDECGFSPETIDKVFLEVFYTKQIKIQTKKAKRQFKAAPKLGFFKDETNLYEDIREIDGQIIERSRETEKQRSKETQKYLLSNLTDKKKELVEKLEGSIRQKVLYASIVENHESLGSFFKPSEAVLKIKTKANEQISKIRNYLTSVEQNPGHLLIPFNIEPYSFPESENKSKNYKFSKEIIKDRLLGAYISISQEIYKEGLGSIQDIELACKEGFKWNIGPFELTSNLKKERIEYLTTLVNSGLDQLTKTGISKAHEVIQLDKNDLSGIQTYIQDNIGFIVIGRLHIQNFQMIQNALSPKLLESISIALKDLQLKKVKSIIFKSQGGGPFCAGADLNYIESTGWDPDKIIAFINLGKKVMNEITNCSIPTVAILDGPAVGGGLELALACDYRIMTDLSYGSLPEVALGIIPDWGGTERLPKLIGKELAKRMICTATLKNLGLKLSAQDGYEVGLADVFVLQSELPNFLSDLIEGKNKKINISVKPERKANYDRLDYPENIIKRFNLDKPFKHNFRFFTRHAALFAEDLINHSDDSQYAQNTNDDKAGKILFKSGKIVANIYIKPFLYIAQNKFLAPLFEKFGLL